MIYLNPVSGQEEDTRTRPMALLIGLLKVLHRSGEGWFNHTNGEGATIRFARAIRTRLFVDQGKGYRGNYVRAMLNAIDPPRCRCGRAGTRIMGGTTFCTRCGPLPKQAARNQQRRDALDQKRADRTEATAAFDAIDVHRRDFRRTKKSHA